MATTLRIKIGAAADRSIEAVFGSMEQRSKRAARVIQQNLNAGMGKGGPYRSRPDAGYDAAARAAERSAKRQTTATENSVRDQMRALTKLGRFVETEMNRQARSQARAAEQISRSQQRTLDRFANRTSYRATRFLFPPPSGILGSARRMGSDMLRGAGVDFNFGSAVGRGVDLQRKAIALSNQGYDPNDPNKGRIDPSRLMNESRAVGSKYGFDASEIMKAHDAFTSLTGDLNQSLASMDSMAKLAAATGTSMDDMAAAQAEVSNALGKTENKSEKIDAVMRMVAGQGKVGAVEVKNMAKGIAAITSQAPQFQGAVDTNIEKLSALAQIAKETGGASNAQEALIGVARFAGTFKTNARVNEFSAAGVNVYDKNKKIRDPYELIKESLVATKGDPLKMGKLWMSVMGQRGVTGLTNAYNTAGGGAAGLKAVQEQLDKYGEKARMSKALVDENAGRAAASDAAKAQRFQNDLDTVVSKMASDLLPAMERLAPAALKVTEAFAKVVDWATKNPGSAITAAVVASIARAGLESAGRAALETAIKTALGAGTGVPGAAPAAGGAAGLAGLAGLTLTVGTLAVVATSVAITSQQDLANENTRDSGKWLEWARRGNAKDRELAEEQITKKMNSTAKGSVLSTVVGTAAGGGLGGIATLAANYYGTLPELKSQKSMRDEVRGLGREFADALAGREMRVRLTNPEDIKTDKPTVDPSGRSPAPGKR